MHIFVFTGKTKNTDDSQSTSKVNPGIKNDEVKFDESIIKTENLNGPNNNFTFKNDTVGNRFDMTNSTKDSKLNIKKENSFNVTDSKCNFNTPNSYKNISLSEIQQANGPCGNIVLFLKSREHPCFALHRTAQQWKKTCSISLKKNPNSLWYVSLLFFFILLNVT